MIEMEKIRKREREKERDIPYSYILMWIDLFKNYILKMFINSRTLSYVIKYILNIFDIGRTLIKL